MSFGSGPPPVGYRGPGGFKAPLQEKPRPPPSGANPELWSWFDDVDKNQSGQINVTELRRALINGDLTPFDLNTVNLLMNIFDRNRNGRISFDEFVDLWKFIEEWREHFTRFDSDRSGTIDSTELQNALTEFGYKVTPELLDILQRKYDVNASPQQADNADQLEGTPAGITFDRFVRACVVLRRVKEAFADLDADPEGWAKIDYLQLLKIVLSLP